MAIISHNDIAKAIYLNSQNKTGSDLDIYLKNVVQFLVKKRLISKNDSILAKLKSVIDKDKGILEVKVSSPTKLNTDTRHHIAETLKKRYDAKDVSINEIIDETLIGGLKVEAKDEVIDMTIKNKLRKLQEHLSSI